jgi:hypothetical protein
MAILFFEGFDRSTVTKELDPNYWSFEPQQPVEYRKYAFGGYSYDHTEDNYGNSYYDYYSPNNAMLPSGIFQKDYSDFVYSIYISGNYYPGFGQPLGFLALHNLDISNNSLLAPITYLQISGFNIPQSGQSFLSTRILGIETKDTNYAASDKAGRFGGKHPIVAFCSGNTTGLILNIVKTTGNHIDFVENQRMTIGLEVEQNNAISGTFDLNISSDVDDYKLKSVYSNQISYQSGDMIGRILTIDTRRDEDTIASYRESPISRWCHFQFGIVQTGEPYIQIKVEDVDLLSIPTDDTNNNKDFWEDKIYISGFDYDNIRFFNRTYNGSIEFIEAYISQISNRYYMLGSTTLIDDIILSDGNGTPNNFLGSNAKVIPFTPGLNRDITNNGTSPDGPLEWNTNASSHRAALKNADGDTGKISTSTPGAIAAIKYKNDNIYGSSSTDDPNSRWRGEMEDAVGGMKVYTQAKKEFLDSSYEIIIATGDVDAAFINNVLLITNGDVDSDSVIDRTRKQTFTKIDEVVINTGITRFSDHASIEFNNSYVYTNNITSLNPTITFNGSLYLLEDNLFTLESFVYFTGDQPITLFSTVLPTGYPNPASYLYSESYEVLCYTGWIDYNYYVHDIFYERVRLYFPESINTGEWNHVALSRAAKDTDQGWTYPLVAFLNGVSGTSFNKYQQTEYFNWISSYLDDGNYGADYPYMNQYILKADNYYLSGLYSRIDNNIDLGINSGIVNINTTPHSGTLTGSGLFSNPLTGTLTGYIPSYNSTSINILDFDVNYSGNLLMKFQAKQIAGTSANPRLEILKNNILQITGPSITADTSYLVYQTNEAQKNISVQSGDNIKIRYQANSNDYRDSLKEFYLKSAYIGDDTLPVENSLYYLPSGAP